ncbi:transcriptional regulator, XRE family [Denitrovibrio acetiphilus DSM 12809]|uniref:Transcriptional regulator, XRE family n=1 Tax=Denitrovibrio acetiphilus (strain DSM 12809 / NBRC 114555 / N2460) TaxID=522772 RepID=D4H8C7_DENA2|nr:XRE family transcriptional regulator [Denitrovibrio acetiphilus]ADD68276.1 transcriptional regulator, XRE family [Denitrovibrio acetiphilus DSM 12809]
MEFGKTVKELRLKHNMTLRDLAKTSGCSISFLSQLERDLISPTVASLRKIADALGVTITSFFSGDDSETDSIVVRKDKRVRLGSKASKVVYESLKHREANSVLEPLYHILDKGAYSGDDYNIHLGEEFVYVMKGQVEITLDGRPMTLNEGDSALYNSNVPHRWKNTFDGETILLWVNTPPTF